jgi:hypothetical protein
MSAFPPCFFCGRTDIASDEQCPWGCVTRHGPPPGREAENSPEYYVHQAREFHKHASEDYPLTRDNAVAILTHLVIAVDYLIELEEARLRHGWIH